MLTELPLPLRNQARSDTGTLMRLDSTREVQLWFRGEYGVMLTDNTSVRWSRQYVLQRRELLKHS
jgi:hypothetical protein